MSVHELLFILQAHLAKVVSEVPSIVQTVVREMFRLHKGNSRGVLDHPVAVCCASQSKFLIADTAKARLFCAHMHYPFDVEVIAKGMSDP